ncbi:hypothetical protein KIN20_026174, partial [Parelaphostrongylus tenuis]
LKKRCVMLKISIENNFADMNKRIMTEKNLELAELCGPQVESKPTANAFTYKGVTIAMCQSNKLITEVLTAD